MIIKPEKLKKIDLINAYKQLSADYEKLSQQYSDLVDYYAELEKEELTIGEIKQDAQSDFIEKLLKELRFNTELQNQIFKIYKKHFIDELEGILNLYCMDITEETWNAIEKIERGQTDYNFYSTFEDYVENFVRFN